MQSLHPKPPKHHGKRPVFIHPGLLEATHVFLRRDMLRRPLQQPYDGPFKVLQRKDKVFFLDINGKRVSVSIDRCKPAFFLNTEDLQLPQTKNETPATVEPNATASTPATVESVPTASTPTQPSTRSGRKVHLPTSWRVGVPGRNGRLRGGGLYARRPVVCVPLTRQHHTARLQWCREHHNWTEQDWACVLFSDESRFSLSLDCRRQLIWREGYCLSSRKYPGKDRYPTCSIMVWTGIMINGRTRLHVVANGTMTGQRYIDEVLLPHVCLFRGAIGDKFVFMDDNATCHRTLAVQDCLDSEGIQRLVWPARSPDLNSIENVWDALGRQVVGRNYPPINKNTLISCWIMLCKVWYDVWNVASHSTVDISRTDTFL
ncbi:transposable element Tcb2 transposase [Trichonephila clavipes]|nr:transposable element Tcb2 transposase [Trichonephila clavipes]